MSESLSDIIKKHRTCSTPTTAPEYLQQQQQHQLLPFGTNDSIPLCLTNYSQKADTVCYQASACDLRAQHPGVTGTAISRPACCCWCTRSIFSGMKGTNNWSVAMASLGPTQCRCQTACMHHGAPGRKGLQQQRLQAAVDFETLLRHLQWPAPAQQPNHDTSQCHHMVMAIL